MFLLSPVLRVMPQQPIFISSLFLTPTVFTCQIVFCYGSGTIPGLPRGITCRIIFRDQQLPCRPHPNAVVPVGSINCLTNGRCTVSGQPIKNWTIVSIIDMLSELPLIWIVSFFTEAKPLRAHDHEYLLTPMLIEFLLTPRKKFIT